MLSRAGQLEGGITVRPLAPLRGFDAALIGALSERLRVGASISGAALRKSFAGWVFDGEDTDTQRYQGVYAEALAGFERRRSRLRYGGFLGAGYGATTWTFTCDSSAFACSDPERTRIATRYMRYHAQGYLGVAPTGPFSASFGLRVPVDSDLERDGAARRTRVGAEPFASVGLTTVNGLRFELQWLYTRDLGPHMHLGLHLRFDLLGGPPPTRRSRSADRFLR
jgi:hypothetical protein